VDLGRQSRKQRQKGDGKMWRVYGKTRGVYSSRDLGKQHCRGKKRGEDVHVEKKKKGKVRGKGWNCPSFRGGGGLEGKALKRRGKKSWGWEKKKKGTSKKSPSDQDNRQKKGMYFLPTQVGKPGKRKSEEESHNVCCGQEKSRKNRSKRGESWSIQEKDER